MIKFDEQSLRLFKNAIIVKGKTLEITIYCKRLKNEVVIHAENIQQAGNHSMYHHDNNGKKQSIELKNTII